MQQRMRTMQTGADCGSRSQPGSKTHRQAPGSRYHRPQKSRCGTLFTDNIANPLTNSPARRMLIEPETCDRPIITDYSYPIETGSWGG